MAKVTYIGSGEPGEPGRIQWGMYTFELNKPTEVSDPHIIAKATNNPHFKVGGNGGAGKVHAEAEEIDEDDLTAAEKESAEIAEEEEDEEKPVKRGPGRPRKIRDEDE